MAKVVLATVGSLGDLHPFIAIGRALAARGDQVLLAVPEDGLAKARAAGLDAAAILPSYETICARLGMTQGEAAAEIISDVNFVLDEVLLPTLAASTRALDDLSSGADVIVGSIFALAAVIVAEKRGLPFASIVLQPMTMFSAWQPPAAPRFEMMRQNPRTIAGRSWNRALIAVGRVALRRRLAGQINAVRAEHGLARMTNVPLVDHGPTTRAVVCCWPKAMGILPPDAPRSASLVGFPLFDSESGAEEPVLPELLDFLSAGDAPIVFTLGSIAVASPGRFYEEAAAASRMLGKRSLMLTGGSEPPRIEGGCMYVGYAPHSIVFPRAAAVVHHGGIGTTGQTLRAGNVQIVVPHYGDQFDNAARLRRAGVGLTIRRARFERRHAANIISRALSDSSMASAAHRIALEIREDDGAAAAAHVIAGLYHE